MALLTLDSAADVLFIGEVFLATLTFNRYHPDLSFAFEG